MTANAIDFDVTYARMEKLINAMYGPEFAFGTPGRDAILREYDSIVETLLSALGENVACSRIDMEMWNMFSDLYKDRNGFRPRGDDWTFRRVKDWLDADAKEYMTE